MNGGYINIDASGLDISKDVNQSINGFYKKILNAKKADKPIFLYNVVDGNSGKLSPIVVFCSFTSNGEIITCNFSSLQITVNKNDDVMVIRG